MVCRKMWTPCCIKKCSMDFFLESSFSSVANNSIDESAVMGEDGISKAIQKAKAFNEK